VPLAAKVPVDIAAEELFAPLGPTYERASAVLSLGLEAGWRRRLVERAAPAAGELWLDVATGTGLVARELRSRGARVVGVDLSASMLGAAPLAAGERLVLGRAERLPFRDGAFDGLTVTYLLRYVDDPVATVRELRRVVRPGGRLAMLEFGRPRALPARLGWWLYTRAVLPALGAFLSPDWRAVGGFLGRSIDRFWDRYDMRRVWADAGAEDVRTDRLFFGAAEVTSAGAPATARAAPAFYALRPGGWRDYVTLLHPPYTLWHLSYVALGAALASEVPLDRLAGTLAAFFLALGVGVHALDELHGRPLGTRIPRSALVALAALGLGGALALGAAALPVVGSGLAVFMAVGALLAIAYPLELVRGRLHGDLWFALGWGAFPVLTAAYASGGSLTAAAVAGAAYAVAMSYAQRALSTWVRLVRRKAESVSGEIRLRDGGHRRLDAPLLVAAAETGLRWLTAVAVLVAALALAVRLA